jgi:predicted phosphodiesterase
MTETPAARIAVLADVHGNLPALEAVMNDLSRRGLDVVVNLGDHASGPLWPRETLDVLTQTPWLQIAGNCDRQLVRDAPADHGASDRFAFASLTLPQKAWLAALPPTATLPEGVSLVHGTPSDDATCLLEVVERDQVRLARGSEVRGRLGGMVTPVVLCAHSHIPRIVRLGETLIINPGSVGLPAYTHDRPAPHVMETGSPDARYAVLGSSGSGWRAELVAVPYDHEAAAAQAGKNGRDDWALFLRTGYAPA